MKLLQIYFCDIVIPNSLYSSEDIINISSRILDLIFHSKFLLQFGNGKYIMLKLALFQKVLILHFF